MSARILKELEIEAYRVNIIQELKVLMKFNDYVTLNGMGHSLVEMKMEKVILNAFFAEEKEAYSKKDLRQGLKREIPIREFQAVTGGEARLPCNIVIPKEPDVLSLILWYREAPKSPIYTLDFRKGPPDQAKHFPGKTLTDRAHFETTEYPPTLKIKPAKVEDEGIYRCRIEYRRARTVTRPVKLNIIVPPQAVVIMDDRGQRLKRLAGPYDEGAYLSLLCEAEGGNPSPIVTWSKEGALVDDTYFRTAQGFVRNELVVLELRRSDFMVEYTCKASNTNLTQPINASVRIDLNMKPLYVRITTKQKPLKVGDDLRLDCETSGSRPAAKLVWWMENRIMSTGKQSFFTNRNVTYSSIHLSPKVDDNGKIVMCKAENPTLQHSDIQDSWYLNIYFPPEVSLTLGANIKYSTIKEGNDVYLECIIKANPPVSELIWFFDGIPFFGNASAGVIISNQSLVLQKVRKEHRGKYRCMASNSEGQGESQELLLEVRYAPACKPKQKNLYGVARNEAVNVSCEVEADPNDVAFRWALNNSVENLDLHNFTSEGTHSVLTYVPRTMLEFGAVLCWSKNAVGEQKEPCVVRIIPAGPPDPVRNCIVTNRSQAWIMVECEAGYNGGLSQKFHLDVYNSAVDHLQVNMSSKDSPVFSVSKLPPGTAFVLVIYSSNEKGKSSSVALMGTTMPVNDLDGELALMGSLSPLVAILIAVFGTLLVIGVVALALVQIRRRRPRKAPSPIEEDKIKMSKSWKKDSDELVENTVACPDVVPPNNMCDSESLESALVKEGQSPDSMKCSKNYRNCVVALKRSWSLKKRCQEKSDIEVSLADLNYQDELTRIPLSPTTIVEKTPWYEQETTPTNKNVVLIVEAHNDKCATHKTIVPQQSTTPF
ncbi:nephrin-like [Uloborus diversus]|uniref:nephrin-like n=1 Tax=Uloborus diversus TaxID=327109 RepID=UPI00240A68D1|nr:nephrin-like [Uloborus diversus]